LHLAKDSYALCHNYGIVGALAESLEKLQASELLVLDIGTVWEVIIEPRKSISSW
jgi:hypothetical protein